MEMDYTEEERKRFYDLMSVLREEISFLRISEVEKLRLYSLADETIGRYEEGKDDYLRKQENLIMQRDAWMEFFSHLREILVIGNITKSKLENELLPNAQRALLNVKKAPSKITN